MAEVDHEHGEADLVVADGSGSTATVLLDAKLDFSPRDAQSLARGLPRRLRRTSDVPLLVVVPHLSPTARELLRAEDISYVDLTGNVRLALRRPGLFIETDGLRQDSAATRSDRSLRGAKAGAVIRLLVDVRPPYTAAEVAAGARVNEGYISRVLDVLVDEGLVERQRRGPITDVDWAGAIERRARAVNLLNGKGTHRFVAGDGPLKALDAPALKRDEVVVTGPLAAARLAPLLPPSVLMAYTSDPRALARRLHLVAADDDPDTLLIKPETGVVFERVEREG
ncbi:MAG TPA: hypothetical protein VG476_16180, partial [Acidimicrobiales bacterium]|nr:hypothetical protein [Acidimicrobiales bacterium]